MNIGREFLRDHSSSIYTHQKIRTRSVKDDDYHTWLQDHHELIGQREESRWSKQT